LVVLTQRIQTHDAQVHIVARGWGKRRASIQPLKRFRVSLSLVGVPGAALENLHAERVALFRSEIGLRRRVDGGHRLARLEQRQGFAIGGFVMRLA